MAKFRTNHQRKTRGGPSLVLRVLGLFFFVAFLLLFIFLLSRPGKALLRKLTDPPRPVPPSERYYLPRTDQAVQHLPFWSLAYDSLYQHPTWVAGEIRQGQEDWSKDFRMTDRFRSDSWDPFIQLTQTWNRENDRLFFVAGPLWEANLSDSTKQLPAGFFQVLLDVQAPDFKGIGFLLRQPTDGKSLHDCAVSIDSVESLTGLEFFPELMTDSLQSVLEATFDPMQWPIR